MPSHRGIHLTSATIAAALLITTLAHAQLNRIAEIKVEGNQDIGEAVIREVLVIKVGDDYEQEDVEADLQAIREMGFFKTVEYEPTRRHDGVLITFRVEENPVIGKIAFEGNTELPTEALMNVVHSKPDNVMHNPTVGEDVARIEELYRSQGLIAKVWDVDTDPANDNALTFYLREVMIEEIQIEGLKKTRPYVIQREMKTRPGTAFNAKTLQRDLNKLFNLNLFENLEYERRPGNEEDKVIVVIKVTEKKTGTAAVGLGFSSRSELVGFADLEEKNFRGKGQNAQLRLEFGDRRSWATSFYEPWMNDKHTSLGVELFDQRIYREPTGFLGGGLSDNSVFEERRKGGRVSVGRPLSDTVAVSVALKNERASFANTQNAGVLLPFGDVEGHVSSLKLGITHDTRDIHLDPSSGGRESFELEWANSLLGGQDTFMKWEVDLRRYLSLTAKGVLAGRFQAGITTGSLPPYEQYFAGGAETLRGFNVDRAFGENLVLFNMEYRHRLQKNFQAVAFVDYGDAYGGQFSNRANFDGLLGYGVGIRVKTPLGPIRLDQGFSEDGSRTHFSIGQMF